MEWVSGIFSLTPKVKANAIEGSSTGVQETMEAAKRKE
jgi:hypothetical protein